MGGWVDLGKEIYYEKISKYIFLCFICFYCPPNKTNNMNKFIEDFENQNTNFEKKNSIHQKSSQNHSKNHSQIVPKALQNDPPEVSGRLSEPPWVSEPSRDLIFTNFELIWGSNLGAKSVKKSSNI